MRNPNGYGGISFLGANRRKPFRVRITTGWDYDENTGKAKQKYATLGYFETRKEAMIALADFNKNPYNLDAKTVTFNDVYNYWSAEKYPKMQQGSIYQYQNAFKRAEPIHEMKMIDIRKSHMQQIMDGCKDFSPAYQQKQKSLFLNIFKYSMENDIVEKNYAQFLTTNITAKDNSIHTPYTENEILKLWDNIDFGVPMRYSSNDVRDIYPVDLILIMIYTGMRPSELLKMQIKDVHLDDRYMQGGLKTEAGRNRIIPIHDDIMELVEKRYNENKDSTYLVHYKSDHPPLLNQYRKFMFDPVMIKLDLVHLPHDGRHTFATFADRSDANRSAIKKIIGHKAGDITQDVYTHKEIAELVNEVNKITFVKK